MKIASTQKLDIDRLILISFVVCFSVIRVFIELDLSLTISLFLFSLHDQVTVLLELISANQVNDHVCCRSRLIRMERSIGHSHLIF